MANAAQLQDTAQKMADDIDKRLEKYTMVDQLAKKAGVKRVYLALGVVLFLVSFILFGFGAGPLCNLVGFAYPLYASYKAINSERTDDDSQWLTYWVVFAFFTLLESFTDLLLFWIPFYHLLKMGFLVWCYLPQTEGALWIYKRFIDPYFAKHEAQIDADIRTVKEEVKSIRKAVGLNAANQQQQQQPQSAAAASAPPADPPAPAHDHEGEHPPPPSEAPQPPTEEHPEAHKD